MDWRRNQERNQIKKWLVNPIIHMPLLHHWACLIGPLIIAPCRVLSCVRLVIPFLLVASLAPSSTMGINQDGWCLLLRLTVRISLVSSLESSPFFSLCVSSQPQVAFALAVNLTFVQRPVAIWQIVCSGKKPNIEKLILNSTLSSLRWDNAVKCQSSGSSWRVGVKWDMVARELLNLCHIGRSYPGVWGCKIASQWI